MATMNPFDLLGDDDNEDPSLLLAAAQLKVVDKPKKASAPAQTQPAKSDKFPTKPAPPAQAVREARSEGGRGGRSGGRGAGRGRGGGRGFDRDSINNEIFGRNSGLADGYRPSEDGERGKPSERQSYGGPHVGFRAGRRAGFSNGEAAEGERPHRLYERKSGTGRGNEFKREGAGRGNWGTSTDEIAWETEEPVVENEKNIETEKPPKEDVAADANKDSPPAEPEEKEPEEDKEMTFKEYEKIREEKRKALFVAKTEERKVDIEKEFGDMQPISSKKSNEEIFIKLGSEQDRRKAAADKEERARKAVSINEFLKPAEGEKYYEGGRGRGRGRGRGPGPRGGYGGGYARDTAAPSIEDPGQFPTLGGK